jgi:predicted glycoside hydrolase/deacetylase ChbG (UPF0249 family)
MKKPGRLMICADDFGLHPAINRGISKAHQEGVLTHASIMALGPSFEEAAGMAADLPDLSIGVHLTLPGNLSGKGQAALLAECAYYSIRQRELARHWRRQITRIRERDIRPTHIDGHQHVHCFPGIFNVAVRLAGEFGITRVRWPRFPRSDGGGRTMGAMFLRASEHVSLVTHRRIGGKDLLIPSIGFGASGRIDSKLLKQLVTAAGEQSEERCVEIFCHPGDDNASLERDLRWGYDWEGELKALCDNEIRELLA